MHNLMTVDKKRERVQCSPFTSRLLATMYYSSLSRVIFYFIAFLRGCRFETEANP